jgi:isocitrate lyase
MMQTPTLIHGVKTVIIERTDASGKKLTIKITAEDTSKENIDRILAHVRAIEGGTIAKGKRASSAQERGHLLAKLQFRHAGPGRPRKGGAS